MEAKEDEYRSIIRCDPPYDDMQKLQDSNAKHNASAVKAHVDREALSGTPSVTGSIPRRASGSLENDSCGLF